VTGGPKLKVEGIPSNKTPRLAEMSVINLTIQYEKASRCISL